MCVTCIDNLQKAMDDAALSDEQGPLIVHIDNFIADALGARLGVPLNVEEVSGGTHGDGADCWCRPIVIESGDTRSAEEIFADFIIRDTTEAAA